jgi:anti-anti-sigma factor
MVPVIRARLAGAGGDIELDCSGLTFVDAAGVNMFVELHQMCAARGATLTLVNPSPCVTRLLELTGVAAVMDARSESPA